MRGEYRAGEQVVMPQIDLETFAQGQQIGVGQERGEIRDRSANEEMDR